MTRSLTLCAALALLAGCTIDLAQEGPPERRYWLSPPALEGATGTTSPRVLHVSVRTVPGLDTDRMLVLRPDRQLQPIAGAYWVAPAPRMLESLLAQSLESGGSHAAVIAGATNRAEAARLTLELQRFFGVGSSDAGAPAEISLEAAVSYVAAERVLRCRNRFTTNVPGTTITAVVGAHQDAVDALAAWLVSIVGTGPAPAGCTNLETTE